MPPETGESVKSGKINNVNVLDPASMILIERGQETQPNTEGKILPIFKEQI